MVSDIRFINQGSFIMDSNAVSCSFLCTCNFYSCFVHLVGFSTSTKTISTPAATAGASASNTSPGMADLGLIAIAGKLHLPMSLCFVVSWMFTLMSVHK